MVDSGETWVCGHAAKDISCYACLLSKCDEIKLYTGFVSLPFYFIRHCILAITITAWCRTRVQWHCGAEFEDSAFCFVPVLRTTERRLGKQMILHTWVESASSSDLLSICNT